MTNGELLQQTIEQSGISITFIANRMGRSRNRVYAIIDGADCTASEIVLLSEILHLTKEQRDAIFLVSNVNEIHA